jgi:hypothetical protein
MLCRNEVSFYVGMSTKKSFRGWSSLNPVESNGARQAELTVTNLVLKERRRRTIRQDKDIIAAS